MRNKLSKLLHPVVLGGWGNQFPCDHKGIGVRMQKLTAIISKVKKIFAPAAQAKKKGICSLQHHSQEKKRYSSATLMSHSNFSMVVRKVVRSATFEELAVWLVDCAQ